jgi:DNA-binding MarR family transcriptional regulator
MNHQAPVHPPKLGIVISARVGLLAGRMAATASATYARLGLGAIEAKVMLLLADGGLEIARVCEQVSVDRSAVSRTVKALVERGLVSRPPGRGASLTLTPAGLDLCVAVKAVTLEREQRAFEGLCEADLDVLLGYLLRLADNTRALSPPPFRTRASEITDTGAVA